MQKLPHLGILGALVAASLFLAPTVSAVNPNVRGRIIGHEKLFPEVYVEAAKTDAHRWTWREPSPAVDSKFFNLSGNPSRDLCIAAVSSGGGGAQDKAMLMSLTGGRIFPTTIVVAPGQKLQFKNFDPFSHRIYAVGNPSLKAENQTAGGVREWTAPTGAGKFEFRDELAPSVRTFVIVDPQVVQITYPGHDNAFAFTLANGDYVLKAYFDGKPVGQPVPVAAKDRLLELKDPFNVAPGAEGGAGSK
jgi:hypothetical protein